MRCIALGCKNYLFAGSDAGGECAAVYTLIATTKLKGLDPLAYLAPRLSVFIRPPGRMQFTLSRQENMTI